MTVQITEFAKKHLAAIVRLLNDEYRDHDEFIPFDEERVQSEVRSRRLRLLVAEENGKVLGFIGTHSHENSEEHISWLAAIKGQNQKLIENMLVSAVEKNVKAGAILIMSDEGSPKIVEWTRRGYTLQPGFQRMSAKLDGLKPVPKVDEDTKLRSLRVDEEEEFVETVNRGFGWKRLERGDLETWKVVPMRDAPGEKFEYNSMLAHMMSAVLTKASGKSTKEPCNEWIKYYTELLEFLL
jgi:hypothetical protein